MLRVLLLAICLSGCTTHFRFLERSGATEEEKKALDKNFQLLKEADKRQAIETAAIKFYVEQLLEKFPELKAVNSK